RARSRARRDRRRLRVRRRGRPWRRRRLARPSRGHRARRRLRAPDAVRLAQRRGVLRPSGLARGRPREAPAHARGGGRLRAYGQGPGRMIVAAVPVKDVVNAKQRLMRILDGPERSELARAMLIDVLRALAAARLDRVWAVTREPDVAGIARSLGAEPLGEPDNLGHTAAVAVAQAEATRAGARASLTIPGDVPRVT